MNRYKTLYIFYDNCKKNCKHCFCKPSTDSTIQKTGQLLDSLLKKEQNVQVFITDQTRPEIRNIIKRVGYNLVELKDEVNINHVNERGQINFPNYASQLQTIFALSKSTKNLK